MSELKARPETKGPPRQDKPTKKPRLRMAVAALLMIEGIAGCACKADDSVPGRAVAEAPDSAGEKDAGTAPPTALDLAPLHTVRNRLQNPADRPALDADASADAQDSD